MSYVHVVLPRNFLLITSQLMTGTAQEDGREVGWVLKFPSTSLNDLGVTVYEPLGGVPVVYLEVVKEGKLRHG